MSHAALVARAVRWLRATQRCKLALAEIVSTATPETPDAIGWRGGWSGAESHLVEVKTSRADFLRDRKKLHAAHPEMGMGRQRWYLVPGGLLTATDVPEWTGLLHAVGARVVVVKEAPVRDRYASTHEVSLLLSLVARMRHGRGFDEKTGRVGPWRPERARA